MEHIKKKTKIRKQKSENKLDVIKKEFIENRG